MITKKGQDYSLNGVDWYSTSAGTYLLASNNLSDLVNIATARVNLGVLSLTNATNNRIVTSSGGLVLNSEANLTFDGTAFTVTGNLTATGYIGSTYITASVNSATTEPIIDIVNLGTGDAVQRFICPGEIMYTVGIDATGNYFKIYGNVAGDGTLGATDGNCGFIYNYNAGAALVGIGEATPLYTLHVTGTFYLSGAYSNDLRFDAANRLIAPADSGTRSLTLRGSDVAGAGGGLTLRGGNSSGAAGGAVTITGGSGAVGVGGNLTLTGGVGSTTGGEIILIGGAGAAVAGNVYLGDTTALSYVQVGTGAVPGTIAAKAMLHVAGESAVNSFHTLCLENKNSGFDTSMLFDWNDTTWYSVGVDQSATRKFKIYNGTALGDTVANIGYSFFVSGGLPYVGIGKEAVATYTLDVTGDIRCTDDLFVNDDATIAGSLQVSDGVVNILNSSGGTTPILNLSQIVDGDVTIKLTSGVISYVMGFDDTDNSFKIYNSTTLGVTDGLCGFVFDANGGAALVGIGENTPLATLHVTGTAAVQGTLGVTSGINYGADADGANDDYIITLSPAITAYTAGMIVFLSVAAANADANATLAVNGMAAKAIIKNSGALAGNDITAGDWYLLIYDGTQFRLLNPQVL